MTDRDLPAWPWDAPPRRLLDALHQQLSTRLRAGPLYLLIDPVFGDPPGIELESEASFDTPTAARQAAWARNIHTLYDREYRSNDERTFPYLVRLEDTDDPWFETSLEWASQEHLIACALGAGTLRIGGWLQLHQASEPPSDDPKTDPAGQVLARQLTHLMRQGSSSLTRIWDRRVLHTLRLAGEGIHWEQALRGIHGWHYLDFNLRLQGIAGHAGPLNIAHLLAPSQCAELLRDCNALHTAQYLLLRHAFPLPDNVLAHLHPKVTAARRALIYPRDQAAYAAEALREPAFEQWPRLSWLLDTVRSTRQELADALELLRHEWAGKSVNQWNTSP